ncbi:energy-coupling factor transporter transmembrane component T [Loigolactobacillus zhaoyuanensis]|uniref:energy-coupling factor transporter transmembrane component T n=1 Tax=Loigolactobacillus zhaoyuanensis TaxID=2486017 RepID=UPI000F737F1A|nr:energy-coupling factor transporter transmembrane component T [Loigolactobacillus zhaoyuanensis]
MSTKLPSWLTTNTPLPTASSRHHFLEQNSHRLEGLLARFSQAAEQAQPALKHYLPPQIKLLTTFGSVLLLSLNQNLLLLWLILLVDLGLLLTLPQFYLRRVLRQTLTTAAMALLLILPSLLLNANVWLFASKTALILLNLNYYRTTTTFSQVIQALQQLHCPNGLIFVVDITLTYLKMLGEFLLGFLQAVTLRTVGQTKHPYRTIGLLFGTLYLKTRDYALALYAAMEARGFIGEYPRVPRTRKPWRDNLYIILDLAIFGLLFLFGR